MRAILEFELTDGSQKQAHIRALQSEELARTLHTLVTTLLSGNDTDPVELTVPYIQPAQDVKTVVAQLSAEDKEKLAAGLRAVILRTLEDKGIAQAITF